MKCCLILDQDGKRVSSKYYNKAEFPTHAAQTEFETKLFKKTRSTMSSRGEADVVAVEGSIAVFRPGADVTMYVVGAASENELILGAVLDAMHDALAALLR